MLLMSYLQTTRTAEEHNALLDRNKLRINCFKCNSDVQRYEELKNLNNYLHYRIVYTSYEGQLASAALTVDELRKKHVNVKLLEFDMTERQQEEARRWHRSPLFKILRSNPFLIFLALVANIPMMNKWRCRRFFWRM